MIGGTIGGGQFGSIRSETMPSKDAGSVKRRATFAGVGKIGSWIEDAIERRDSEVYAASLRRAADSIRSMKFVEHAHDELIRLAEEEDQAISPADLRRDLEIPHPPHVRISVDALATAHDIAAVAGTYDGEAHVGNATVGVNLADLRALRAMLPKRESEKEKADRLFEEYKEAVPAGSNTPDLHAALGVISHEETQAKLQRARHVQPPIVGPLNVPMRDPGFTRARILDPVKRQETGDPIPTGPVECKLCRAWHRPPACTTKKIESSGNACL